MEEARAKFTRFVLFVKTLPGINSTYLIALTSASLETFVTEIRRAYLEHLEKDPTMSTDPRDIAVQILAHMSVAVEKMKKDDLHVFVRYIEYFLRLAVGAPAQPTS